jgi:phosphoribosylamine--glycine ligase
MQKKILIIGGGGREHSLAWKLSQSPRAEKIYIAPGNAGTATIGENIPIPATDLPKLLDFAVNNSIDITVVGQDDPLALGIVDLFRSRGLKIFGPTKAAAQIESSKVFAKNLMHKGGIPTAEFQTFSDYNKAFEYVKSKGLPTRLDEAEPRRIVIKASGLALGKGVTVAKTLDEAEESLRKIMIGKIFGESGSEVVIEEFLQGQEISIHVFSDGKSFKLFPTSQDHKPIGDGDTGPNTGGMGTIAPLSWVSEVDIDIVSKTIVSPILRELDKAGATFTGLLYPGIIAVPSSSPPLARGGIKGEVENNIVGYKVIEFNSRFGDPECESYMRLIKTDLLDVIEACIEGRLDEVNIEWNSGFACCVIAASGGYPDKYEKGFEITGIDEANKQQDVLVFHAGTTIKEGKVVTSGGRVLGVSAVGNTLKEALDKAYETIKLINFKGMYYRKDIGLKALPNTK